VTQASVAPGTAKTTDTVAVGNTTAATPSAPAAPAAPLPAPPPAAAPKPETFLTALPVPPQAVAGSCNIPDYAYPQEAKAQGIQGITEVHILLDEEGRVKKARITRSADTWLDQTALFWVEKRCRFSPGRDAEGLAVPSVMVQTYDWKILHEDTWNRRR
jgi:TonB family protein